MPVATFYLRLIYFMKNYYYVLAAALPIGNLIMSMPAYAANPPLVTPSDRAENYQRQQELQKTIQRESDNARTKALESQKPEKEMPIELKGGASYLINEIDVDVGAGMPVVNIDDILARYNGRQLNVADIYALVQDVTNRYIERGYTTTTVSLKPTNLNAGKLQLVVLWGRVEGWLIDGKPLTTWKEHWLKAVSLPDVIGKPLNIYAVDRSIEVLNNGAKSAKVEVAPGSKLGYSILNIVQVAGSPFFNAGINNQSVESTANGRFQGTLGAGFGDVLLPNDRISVSGSSRYYNEAFGNDEYSANLSYSIPVGYSDLALRYSKTTYHKEIVGDFGGYGSNGDSATYGMKYTYNVWRNKTDKLSLYSDLEAKESNNYIEDTLLEVNSKPFRSLTLGGVFVAGLGGGFLYSDVSLSKGLSWFAGEGAAVDSNGNAKNFKRAKADVSWTYPFSVREFPLEYAVRTSAQYSRDSMVSSYKMGVGDEFTVRGYKGTPSFGDRGILLSNTLSHTYSADTRIGPASLRVSGGLDWGRVQDVDYSGGYTQTLTGGSLGLNAAVKKVSLGLGYAIPFKKIKGVDTPSEAIYLSLGVGF